MRPAFDASNHNKSYSALVKSISSSLSVTERPPLSMTKSPNSKRCGVSSVGTVSERRNKARMRANNTRGWAGFAT